VKKLIHPGGCGATKHLLAGLTLLLSSAAFATPTLYFVHPDHLNTPRLVTDASQQAVWKWDQAEPFGVNMPNENPSSLGAFEFPLRFPGQYADKETNQNYNFFRDYDPSIGRYIQSDPVGLKGGLNTYGYVGGIPVSRTDPSGLFMPPAHFDISVKALGMSGCGNRYSTAWDVVTADFNPTWNISQDQAQAKWHGMCNGAFVMSQNTMMRSELYIESEIQKCTKDGLAWALHAAQDSCAGGHQGCYYGSASLGHAVQDLFPSRSEWMCAFQKSMDVIARFKARCGGCCN
jgi:RHS repeat-associated protein